MTQGLQYRIGKIADDGTVTVEVAEVGHDEWHTLATHKSLAAATDQIDALNESSAAPDGRHLSPDEFVDAVKQVLQVKPEHQRPAKKS